MLFLALLFIGAMGQAGGNCYDNHHEGKRCTLHKTRDQCVTYYNKKAGGPGIDKIDQICGWSIDTSKFNGQEKYNCRSKPFIQRKKWVPIADFGACQAAVEYEDDPAATETPTNSPTTPFPTASPTCADCRFHDGDKKGCKSADPATYCVDQCAWNKQNDTCQSVICNDYTSLGMIKCDKKAKKMGATCYFDVIKGKCQKDEPNVTCLDYNKLPKVKKGCKKVGAKYSTQCEWDKYAKKCKAPGGPTQCDAVRREGSCKKTGSCRWILNSCVYPPEG